MGPRKPRRWRGRHVPTTKKARARENNGVKPAKITEYVSYAVLVTTYGNRIALGGRWEKVPKRIVSLP